MSHLPVVRVLEKIAQNGFQAAEIWYEHVLRTGESASDIRDAALELGLILSLHGPLYDINPTSLNYGIKGESFRQIASTIEFASEINAEIVVIHPGRLSSSKADIQEYWEMMYEFCFFLDDLATFHDVRVGLEGMEKKRHEVFVEPKAISRIMQISWNNLAFTLDSAHVCSFSHMIDFLNVIPFEWVQHVHLSDYSPARIHNPLGMGETNIHEILEILSYFYHGLVIVEGTHPLDGWEAMKHTYHFLNTAGWLNSSTGISYKQNQKYMLLQ
jgi:sugar phosphate isomerase/epimerase